MAKIVTLNPQRGAPIKVDRGAERIKERTDLKKRYAEFLFLLKDSKFKMGVINFSYLYIYRYDFDTSKDGILTMNLSLMKDHGTTTWLDLFTEILKANDDRNLIPMYLTNTVYLIKQDQLDTNFYRRNTDS